MRSLLLCCILALTFAVRGQYTETLDVRLHNLDAIVTGPDGKPVTGLTKEDFIVLEDGVPQPITNFSSFESSTAAMSKPEAPAAEPAPEAAKSERVAPPRRYVFFIDEMGIQAAARAKLKAHALQLVKTMRPGDVAAIVRPSGAARMVQEYTGDIATVEKSLGKAIDECKVRMTAPAFREFQAFRRALETAETHNEINAAKRAYMDGARARVEQRLSQIRALITSMAGHDGKKVLVLITSGLSSQPGREAYSAEEQMGLFETAKEKPRWDPNPWEGMPIEEMGPLARLQIDVREHMASRNGPGWQGMEKLRNANYLAQIDDLGRTAAAEGVTIYALEPEVPLMLDFSRAADSRTLGSTLLGPNAMVEGQKNVPSEMLGQLLHHEGETLTSFAEKTGGKWFRGIGAIDDTFQQVTSDLNAYYSIAYRVRAGDAKPRRVQVVVKDRPELQVRTRSEVIDRSNAHDMSERVLAGLLYSSTVDELKMTVNTTMPKKKGRSYEVPIEIVIPVEKIAFVRGTDGKHRAHVSVHYATAREEREFFSYGRREQLIELTDSQYDELRRIRYRYTSTIKVPKGRIRIAFGVIDTSSKLSSLSTLSIIAQ